MPATVCSIKTNVLCEQLLTFNYIITTGKLKYTIIKLRFFGLQVKTDPLH